MLGMNETMDQLAMVNSVCWHDHLLRREDGHVLRRALYFQVEGEGKKWRPMRTRKKQVEEEGVTVGLRGEDSLCRSKECWRKSDCCWVDVNLAALTCWGYYQILNIGLSL